MAASVQTRRRSASQPRQRSASAGLSERQAWAYAAPGGGHNVCFEGWRVQVIWRTGDHYDHVHIGLGQGCSFSGVQTFQI